MKNEYVSFLKKSLSGDELDEGLKKLDEGISPQYIVGNVDFYGNVIEVNPNVLIPRFETELLVDRTVYYIHHHLKNISNIKVLDIGTGSGCIAISLAKEMGCSVDACDISSPALNVAKKNADINNVDVSFFLSDIFSDVCDKYNVIISNPPYIREDEEIEDIVYNNEPHLALYAKDDGLFFYREILKNAKSYLKNQFIIAFEIGELQVSDVVSFVYQYFNDVDVIVEKDYSGRDRFVFVFSK